jgi:hypothetical protein
MGRVTAGDGCAGSFSWRARVEKHMDDPSSPVTGCALVQSVRLWGLEGQTARVVIDDADSVDVSTALAAAVNGAAVANTRVSSDRHTNKAARREYMRAYMRKRRAAGRDPELPAAVPEPDWDKCTREFQALSPTIQAALTACEVGRLDFDPDRPELSALDIGALVGEYVGSLKRFHRGDVRGLENGLLCQASTLNRIFYQFIRYGCRNYAPELRELMFRIAFRAQAQYRATLATLGAMKNPTRAARRAHRTVDTPDGASLSECARDRVL